MNLPYRWHPAGTRSKLRPDVGDLLPYEHAVWRVVEVHDLPPDRQDKERQPYMVVIRPAGAGSDARDRDRDRHLNRLRFRPWDVYPDEHYPVCASCLEPQPCREKMAEQQSTAAAKRIGMYEIPGVCPACQEPVTERQKSLTWPDNAAIPGGPPVTFHLRRACRFAAEQYERAWVAADPECRRAMLSCPGHVTNHGDGTYSCTEAGLCPGPTAKHYGLSTCRCCTPRPRTCRPSPGAVNRA